MEIKKLNSKERTKWEKKLGKNLRISRKNYKIIYCAGIILDGKSNSGFCLPSEQKIFVDVTLGEVESTLLHEFCHAEIAESGIRQSNSWTMDIEEILAETLAEGLSCNFQLKRL